MKCASATPVGSGVPPARSGWWHAKSRHALLRSRTGLRQSVVAPQRWPVRYYGIGGGKVIPYMCDVNVHYCIVGQVIFCLMILPNIKLLLTLHSI